MSDECALTASLAWRVVGAKGETTRVASDAANTND
jgi:hypothetical protein